MVSKLRSVFRRSEFIDSDSWSEFLYHSGAQPGVDFDLNYVTGAYGAMLRAMHEDAPDSRTSYDIEKAEQEQRQDIFVRKLPTRCRPRRASVFGGGAAHPPSTYISAKQFSEHYAAAAFAYYSGLNCETAVTIWWGALEASDPESAQALFAAFTKDLNDWLCQRELPTAYFFSHENSSRIGHHTHLAVYLCLMRYGRSRIRDEFREWAMGWPERKGLGVRPRAIRVSGPATQTPWLHWHRFHYQVKGYDPSAVVRRGINNSFGNDLMLGDLIACRWQDPGIVAMRPRVGHALNLGPARRQIGIPKDCDELRSDARRKPAAPRVCAIDDILQDLRPTLPPLRPPFVSRYEDGWRDVRCLYPPTFNTRVTKLSYEPVPPLQLPVVPNDFLLNIELI